MIDDTLLERDMENDEIIVKSINITETPYSDPMGLAGHLIELADKIKKGEIVDIVLSAVYRTESDNVAMEYGYKQTNPHLENQIQSRLYQVDIEKSSQPIEVLYSALMDQLAIAVQRPIQFGAGVVNYGGNEYWLGFGQQTEEYSTSVPVYIEDEDLE